MQAERQLATVRIRKLVPGGQGLGELADGRKVFVWNALPGELARVRLIKQKHSFAEAIAEEVLEPAAERIAPREPADYLATSPWQLMTFTAENEYKQLLVQELFGQANVALPGFELTAGGAQYGYRNKMEYSFWGDDDGLHLALYRRGSHGKQAITGSALALPGIDTAANSVLAQLQKMQIRAGDLKTIVIRSSQKGAVAASLFVKAAGFPILPLPDSLQGLRVYYSNPKSPASVPTKLLQELGDCRLQDELLGRPFVYDVDSFFQVNVPVFELALGRIKARCASAELTDMYAGVGTIGLSVATKAVELVELDPATAAMARVNAQAAALTATVVETSSEKALAYITSGQPVSFDPPRAGLHDRVVTRVLEALPPRIMYLSCNPATQARDLARLMGAYRIDQFEAYNFFPRTPHIETLAILQRRD